jgi:hypothetical protein
LISTKPPPFKNELTYRQQLPRLDGNLHDQLLQLEVLFGVAREPKATELVLPRTPLLLVLGLLVWIVTVLPALLHCQLLLLLLVETQLQCRHRGQQH